MSKNSKIEWTDHTFNPWIGCTRVSPGCDNCYAAVSTPARAMKIAWGASESRHRTAPTTWKDPIKWNARHEEFFAQYGRRQRVFCASLADVFDNAVSVQWRYALLRLIMDTPNLDWLLLTKRIGNAEAMLEQAMRALTVGREGWRDNYLSNVWIGATIVNQEEADRDIHKLLDTPGRVRFLSMEPLLGPVDLGKWMFECCGNFDVGAEYMGQQEGVCCGRPEPKGCIDWVIVGGESGRGARPMHPEWARSLRDQCASAGVAFLFKQHGEWMPGARESGMVTLRFSSAEATGPQNPEWFEWADGAISAKVGKKAAGRELDGRTHDEFPRGAS